MLTTTSDWTTLELENFFVEVMRLQKRGNADFQVRYLTLHSQDRTKRRKELVLWCRIYFSLKAQYLDFVIAKGDIGKTWVRLGTKVFVNRNRDGTGRNRRFCRISVAELLRSGKLEKVAVARHRKLVLAFYYPWYGTPKGPSARWVHWDPRRRSYGVTHTPRGGYYDCQDEKVLERQIRLAKQAGIDGFICSWWGVGSFEDQVFEKLCKLAERENFQLSLYYEVATSTRQIQKDMRYIWQKYARSAAFLKIQGLPVIFVYARVLSRFQPEQIHQALVQAKLQKKLWLVADSFDFRYLGVFRGLHTYNPLNRFHYGAIYRRVARCLRPAGYLSCATVIPGYDDTAIRTPGLVIEREEGMLYWRWWQQAIQSQVDWVIITSFNEWHEGTEIEPSREWGEQYLQMTRKFAQQFKSR